MGVGAAIGGAVAIGGARRAKKAGAEAAGQAEELIGMSREQWEWGKERVGEWDELAEEFRTALNGLADEYGVFAQQIWDNWENSFGDMRQNLIDYYNNLDPAKYSSMWKANIEDQMQKEWQQLDQTMAQSGIYTSGMKQQLAKEMSMQQAEANAMADLQAPDYVMQQKNQFYGAYGAPERNQALGFQENAMNWRQNALMQADLFDKAVKLTGLVLTKLDGTAKGGIVIGIKHQLNLPVKLIGVGEKTGDLRDFKVNEFVEAIFE